ncbi:MAG: ABC transporter permease subunit [Gammaproteobacteria bacterium]|nr:ABC transporter permease subunit [Gammaproteobacteria bacterium]
MTHRHHSSWVYQVVMKAQLSRYLCYSVRAQLCRLSYVMKKSVYNSCYIVMQIYHYLMTPMVRAVLLGLWYLCVAAGLVLTVMALWRYLPGFAMGHMSYLMLLTTLRVTVAMLLSLIIFVPLGVIIGLNPRLVKFLQPVIQILAALPPNILYPIMAALLITFHQSLGWWSIGLVMLGTQWYILFNVIAGVSALPQELRDVTSNFQVRGYLYWRHVIIPAIFPYIVTGIISAAGGAWNADITAEFIQWGKNTLQTPGLGAYIATTTTDNLNHQAALGCTLMCGLVALCIIFIWRPLYRLAETRYCIR